MFKNFVIAFFLICLLGLFSMAHAKSTSFSIQVKNKSGSKKELIKGNDLGGNEWIQNNKTKRFSDNDTAYYLKTKTYNHDIEVKDSNGKSHCELDIWLKNKVTWIGVTKITDDHFESNDCKCIIKRDNTYGNDDLSLTLEIKKNCN